MLHSVLYIVLRPDAITYQRNGKRHPLDSALRTGKDLSVWRSDHSGRRRVQTLQERGDWPWIDLGIFGEMM